MISYKNSGQQGEALTPREGGSHSWREILYRIRDPRFLGDSLLRAGLGSWDRVSPSQFSRLYRQVRTHTMCSNSRLRGLYRSVRHVVEQKVPGDIVECGTAKGGRAALIALALQAMGERRKLWLFDTFEGLPAPTANDPDLQWAD